MSALWFPAERASGSGLTRLTVRRDSALRASRAHPERRHTAALQTNVPFHDGPCQFYRPRQRSRNVARAARPGWREDRETGGATHAVAETCRGPRSAEAVFGEVQQAAFGERGLVSYRAFIAHDPLDPNYPEQSARSMRTSRMRNGYADEKFHPTC